MDWLTLLVDPVAASAVAGCAALILFSAAWHKFSEPDVFAGALDAYRLLPSAGVMFVAKVLPFIEAAIGIIVLVPATRPTGLVLFAILIAIYAVAIAIKHWHAQAHVGTTYKRALPRKILGMDRAVPDRPGNITAF